MDAGNYECLPVGRDCISCLDKSCFKTTVKEAFAGSIRFGLFQISKPHFWAKCLTTLWSSISRDSGMAFIFLTHFNLASDSIWGQTALDTFADQTDQGTGQLERVPLDQSWSLCTIDCDMLLESFPDTRAGSAVLLKGGPTLWSGRQRFDPMTCDLHHPTSWWDLYEKPGCCQQENWIHAASLHGKSQTPPPKRSILPLTPLPNLDGPDSRMLKS